MADSKPDRFMEGTELIQRFGEFIEINYIKELMRVCAAEESSLVIDFIELSKFDISIAEMLLEQPDEVIKAAEIALTNFDLPDIEKPLRIRVTNLPLEQKILIRNIRSKHQNKFLLIEGSARIGCYN